MENTLTYKLKIDGRINPGDIIKHPRFLDVACLVKHVYDDGTLAIQWINQGFNESWLINKNVSFVSINSDWLVCNTPEIKCLRQAGWSRI